MHRWPKLLPYHLWTFSGYCNSEGGLFFSHSVIGLLVCLGPLSCCMNQFQSSCSWSTFVYRLVRVRFIECKVLSSRAFKISHVTPPPLCLQVGMRCLCRFVVFGFCQTQPCALCPDISSLVFSVQRTLFHKTSFSIQVISHSTTTLRICLSMLFSLWWFFLEMPELPLLQWRQYGVTLV